MALFRNLLLISCMIFFHGTVHAAPDLPVVVYHAGPPTELLWNRPVHVQSEVLQLALSDNLLLNATKGTEFLLTPTDDQGIRVHVGGGTMHLVDTKLQQVIALLPGTLLLSPSADRRSRMNLGTQGRGALNPEDVHRQGFHFDDYAMLRQRELINRFTIDSATTVNFLSGIAHSVSGRR